MGKLNKRAPEKEQTKKDKFQGEQGSVVKRSEFIEALSAVTVGTGGQMLLEGSLNVVLDDKWMRTYNDFLSVSYPFQSGIRSAVNHEDLMKILNRMEDEELMLQTDEEAPLVIRGEYVKVELPSSDVRIMKYIDDLSLEDLDWQELPEKFMEGLWWCFFSASRKKEEKNHSIFCTGTDMVSTDNYRVGVYNLEAETEPFLISASNAMALLKTGFHFERSVIVNGWIHFEGETGVVVSSRLLDEETYDAPKVKGVVDAALEELDKHAYTFPDKFEDVLSRIAVFASSNEVFSELVDVTFSGSEIICEGRKEAGKIKERIPVKEKYPKIEFKIPIFFVRDILKITRKFNTSGNFIIFRTPNFTQLILTIGD